MKHDKATLNQQRRNLAIIGFLLPILCVVLGLPFMDVNGESFWHSISATYYATDGDVMRIALGIFGWFLFCYRGYDIGDRLTCGLSGAFAWGIVMFPCKCDAAGLTTGLLNLPTNISHVVHCIIAALLFGSFAYMIGCRFTKTDMLVMTVGKKRRNNIYHICAIIIAVAMVSQFATSLFGIGWMTIVNETIMLWSFSFAWAVKSDCFKAFIDRE